MSDNRKVASSLIHEADDTITTKRPGVHGSAEQSFEMIGDLWTAYLTHTRRVRGNYTVTAVDVAQMMSLLKKARVLYGDATNRDNFVDDLGYSALAGMLHLPDPDAVDRADSGANIKTSHIFADDSDIDITLNHDVGPERGLDEITKSAGSMLKNIYMKKGK